jgi:hypothetical protein
VCGDIFGTVAVLVHEEAQSEDGEDLKEVNDSVESSEAL